MSRLLNRSRPPHAASPLLAYAARSPCYPGHHPKKALFQEGERKLAPARSGGQVLPLYKAFWQAYGSDFNLSLLLELLFEVSRVWQGRPRLLAHLQQLSRGSAGLGGLGKSLFHHQPSLAPVALGTLPSHAARCYLTTADISTIHHLLGLPWLRAKVVFNVSILIQVSTARFIAQGSRASCQAMILPVFLLVWRFF